MAYGYIYEITNNINGKKYVGQHKGDGNDTYMGSGIHLKRAQEKYGIENFSKRILNEYDSKEELCEAEKYFIAVYRHFYGLEMMYNIADGGEGGNLFEGHKHSEETKKKQSEAMKGKHHTEESKRKLSEANKGEKNPFYGKGYLIAGEKNGMSRKVNQYDLNGNFIRTWSCIKEVENELGIAHQNISKCCRGKRKSAGKFIWKYAE